MHDQRTCDVKDRIQVGVDDGVPLLGRHHADKTITQDARIVYQQVNLAESANDGFHQLACGVRNCEVGLEAGTVDAGFAKFAKEVGGSLRVGVEMEG